MSKYASKRLEKRDQCLLVLYVQIEPEPMTFYRVSFDSIRLKAGRNVIFARAAPVKPVFERGAPAAVPEHSAIPHPFQRRHLVVARTAAGSGCEIRIGAD